MSSHSDSETETVTVSLTTNDTTETVTVSRAMIELLREDDETAPGVIGDMAVLSLAQQAHGIVHHSDGEVPEQIAAAEDHTMALFEERFGQSYAEMTGHDH
ncbi:MAG: hypothetical protein J07HX5_02061 [halophilic archaeon J07HX5]|nr:MAG: hypothetical protein J07HX5_02061 [halophilic archaeon J07HX5]